MSRPAVVSTQIFARSSTVGAGCRVWEAPLLVFLLFNSGLSGRHVPSRAVCIYKSSTSVGVNDRLLVTQVTAGY